MRQFYCARESGHQYCGNCQHDCRMDPNDPCYYDGCRSWMPDRASHPNVPNPCEVGYYEPNMSWGRCVDCPNVRK